MKTILKWKTTNKVQIQVQIRVQQSPGTSGANNHNKRWFYLNDVYWYIILNEYNSKISRNVISHAIIWWTSRWKSFWSLLTLQIFDILPIHYLLDNFGVIHVSMRSYVRLVFESSSTKSTFELHFTKILHLMVVSENFKLPCCWWDGLFKTKICVFYLMCPFITVLQHGRCATLQCSYYIKYYISYITSQLCFRIQASIYAEMAAYVSIKEIDITHYISRYGVCQSEFLDA